ncbi:DUF1194 domain-containing protein [Colwellia sp. D2M02]|uniref:DUF1194 domain-containing protein n=1 Tax=Colwellia sp. D2M02 TaxID=2841562 RepID=UPI001C0A4343|nr:DUF1194 domain-containing protein [Colwellia sp. D2M02]MBU2893642.1 DUF1194 domain-containing protein [Colwellia sp. D2M02]
MNKISVLFSLLLLSASSTVLAIEMVDVELQLLIDISGSVDNSEYNLQMQGYKAAFESDNVQNAIIGGINGKIAVQLIMWSGRDQQEIMIDWTLIDSADTGDAFAATIDTLARPFSGMTAIGSAINYGYSQFENNGFESLSQVIDVSGDGTNNSGSSPSTASADALAAGIDKINGIVITTNQRVIDQYTNSVVAGDNAFLLAPATFSEFQSAIETKITYEIKGLIPPGDLITPIPEPKTIYLALISFIVLYFNKKRFI